MRITRGAVAVLASVKLKVSDLVGDMRTEPTASVPTTSHPVHRGRMEGGGSAAVVPSVRVKQLTWADTVDLTRIT